VAVPARHTPHAEKELKIRKTIPWTQTIEVAAVATGHHRQPQVTQGNHVANAPNSKTTTERAEANRLRPLAGLTAAPIHSASSN